MENTARFARTFFAVFFLMAVLGWSGASCSREGIGIAQGPGDGGQHDATVHQECTQASDCVVAAPYDCCMGCPEVMTRNELAEETCFYDTKEPPPDDIPPECWVECYACPTCFPQPLDVDCVEGQCVPDGWGCPGSTEEEYASTTVADIRANPSAYEYRNYTIAGVVHPNTAMCTDRCPEANCCTTELLLDGGIYLTGRPCDLDLSLWSDAECADEFHSNQIETEGLLLGHHYEFAGEVIPTDNPWATPSLRVESIRVLDGPPQGPPQGFYVSGGYEVTVLAVEEDASDPVCTPAPWEVGDTARVYAAVADRVRVFAPYFSCLMGGQFEGPREPTNSFHTMVPIDCDGCCCDFFLNGTVEDDLLEGVYESFDGTCRYTVEFSGPRL